MSEAVAQSVGTTEKRGHSQLGIASFVISIFAGVAEFLFIVLAGILFVIDPASMNSSAELDSTSIPTILLGIIMLGTVAIGVLGFGLGLAGWITTNQKRVFCVLGTMFNLAVIVSIGVMILMGPGEA